MELNNTIQPICQACLKYSTEYIEMNTLVMGRSVEESPTYLECFRECTQLDIAGGDGQTKHICIPCSKELHIAYGFIVKVRIAHGILNKQNVNQNHNWKEQGSDMNAAAHAHQNEPAYSYFDLDKLVIEEIIENPQQPGVQFNSKFYPSSSASVNASRQSNVTEEKTKKSNKTNNRKRKANNNNTVTSDHQQKDDDDVPVNNSSKKKCNRPKNPDQWKKNVLKRKRNTGEAYQIQSSNKIREERKVREGCSEKCKLKCPSNFKEDDRNKIFQAYWSMGDIQKQREFIHKNMSIISPKYRYTKNAEKPRDNNNAFFFSKNIKKLRVCKTFFINTLDISNRIIRTVQEKRKKMYASMQLEPDMRGKSKAKQKLK
ncbi:eukaryotic translation initiation factor 5B-like [Episyrphus balteatus]|uniref:eukaryotic translation initiation factor 5B-like n=1 Tax=Episyrphus balteatus TaxID=286459 RepID=UPI0024869D72|nr:eukaryotic translation initiation factor 5B-like [Episyrphus balteatus]